MPTYVYETIPQSSTEEPQRFEIKQSIKDAPLSSHPQTGRPVRRVITGGGGILGSAAAQSSPGPCGSACGCHR